MLCQFTALHLIAISYFRFLFSPEYQTKLLQIINQMRQHSDRKSHYSTLSSFNFLRTKHHFYVYFHCLVGIAWVPVWLYRSVLKNIDVVVGLTWFQHILGEPYNPAVKLKMWEWCAGFVMIVAEQELIFIVNATVVLLCFIVKSASENADHALRGFTEVKKYCVVSSKSVSASQKNRIFQ